MRIKFILLLLITIVLFSCSNTISTTKKTYKVSQTTSLKKEWNFTANEWHLQQDTLAGNGGPMHWGVIESKKQLPKNYEINFKVNMTKESLFEVMLNIDKKNYIRTYLYQIDQNIIIGRGVYNKNSDEYGKRGGLTVFRKPMKLENSKWYSVKIKVLNNQSYFSIDDKTTLECSLEKSNLSQKGKLGFITNGEAKITNLTIQSIQ